MSKLINSRTTLSSERDVFFVQLGGFDSHSDLLEQQTILLDEVNAALGSFVTEMKQQGVWDSVAVVSSSDFGRTLTSNGRGTDHVRPNARHPPRHAQHESK